MSTDTDTIFARASAPGKSGVAVYRISGPAAFMVAGQLIRKEIKIRETMLASICDPKDGSLIDRGLIVGFQGPASFTGEDVVELHLHGARAVEISISGTLVGMGVRPAEAGEFTLRAFRHGKLDLAQVEALADLIDSETIQQKRQALGQLGGGLSAVAEQLRAELLRIMTPLEADIDFPDEGDVPAAIAARASPAIDALQTSLTDFLLHSERARKIRTGINVVIIGPPNAGKSSLINALAGAPVAIVSDIAGTTRDVVEVRLDLNGQLATIADTAGLRHTPADAVEAEGMARALARASEADLRIGVLDPRTTPVSRETISELDVGDILVWSHSDLEPALPMEDIPTGVTVLTASGMSGAGVEALIGKLAGAIGNAPNDDVGLLTRTRHVHAVESAIAALSRAKEKLAVAPELAAEDIRLAARSLGSITGTVGVEEVLGEIFSSFCIGK